MPIGTLVGELRTTPQWSRSSSPPRRKRTSKKVRRSLSIRTTGCVIAGNERAKSPKTQSKGQTMNKPAPISVTVSTVIAAPAEVLYDLVSDVTQMHRFSPENTGATWIGGADGPAVGARFKGTNQLGKAKWSTKPVVTAAEPGSRFSFKVPGAAGAEWTYTFTPADGGTLVTESMAQTKASPAMIRFIQRRNGVTDRAAHLRDAMTTTLDRLARSTATA
jgi:uncharacterized protein YndB with AHSA1/START domain